MTLLQLSTSSASIIGVMDSGTDISHKDLAPKVWVNQKEKKGSKIDLDQDGLPGDINGWDFTENSANVFNNKYDYLLTDDVKTFLQYYGRFEQGLLSGTSAEVAWLKTHSEDAELMNKVNFIGGYVHGTHVAGISAVNNPNAKIISMKIIPTVYEELPKVDPNATAPAPQVVEPAKKTIDQFKAELAESASGQIAEMVALHSYVHLHKADVVNQSFGIGFGDAINFLKAGFIEDIKREPTVEELKSLLVIYFSQILREGPKMFAAAPNTLFTIAAGNDSSNNDLYPDYPANIVAENKIVVAATLGYRQLAEFSNYGATKVDVAAPGVAITSTVPTNTYIPLSGTSQATPYVTNVIATMKDLNPSLTTRDLKAIILGTVDVKDWLKGKVKTSGIVNRARALKAAEFAKTQTVDLAISKARAMIADVPVEKSLSLKPRGVRINFRPLRPSLLIKKM